MRECRGGFAVVVAYLGTDWVWDWHRTRAAAFAEARWLRRVLGHD